MKKKIGIGIGLVLAIYLLGSLVWDFGMLKAQANFANEQTRICEEMRSKALKTSSPVEIVDCLEYAANYYPSGSKQTAGSHLDHVVERYRRSVVRDIIAHLRRITAEDLGESPEPWIRKFRPEKK